MKNQLRILHSTSSMAASAGGPSQSIRGLCRSLKKQGHDVGLFISDANGSKDVEDLLDQGVDIFVSDWQNITSKWREPDFIHDHGIWLPANHKCANFANLMKIPRISSPRGMLEPWAINNKKWKKKIAWALYQKRDLKNCVALHATAPSEADQFRRLGLKNKIGVVPNGVDLPPEFVFRSPHDATPHKTALFLSRIHPKKGLPLLVSAWAQVRPDGWRMRVVGPDEGGHLTEIKKMVSDAGLSSSWQFDGLLEGDQKWQAISEAHLFILPTYSENFGIAIAEALACGVPVLTTKGTPWHEVQTNKCGWWVDPTVSSIEVTLRVATSTPSSELHSMGQRGREWMYNDFLWNGVAKKMSTFYEEILEQR